MCDLVNDVYLISEVVPGDWNDCEKYSSWLNDKVKSLMDCKWISERFGSWTDWKSE